jgi:hypothetical protein
VSLFDTRFVCSIIKKNGNDMDYFPNLQLSAYFLPQITCGELLSGEKMFSTEFSYCCGLVELREFEKIVNGLQLFNIFCG